MSAITGSGDLWSRAVAGLPAPLPMPALPPVPLALRCRRGYGDAGDDDGRESIRLVRDDGVLRWVYEPAPRQQRGRRRAWRASAIDQREVVQDLRQPPLGNNQITDALLRLDASLNPERGLRRWQAGAWRALGAGELAALKGRVLLLVHGTFSKGGMYDSELGATAEGRELFARLTTGKPYAAVLSFEHGTLSVAPWLNALALKEALAPLSGARLDLLCHSRGGLVACWALKIAPELPVDQVVFVGSPLMGTSLAAPNRLREALDLLANVADAVGTVSAGAAVAFPPAMPLAMGAAGLAAALGRVLQLGAAVPLADAVVGLVPGLMAQSRVANNLELAQLFPLPGVARLAGVGGAFVPDEVRQPVWKFWRRFSHIGDQIKHLGADLIFQQPNDLVVDSASMNQLGGPQSLIPAADWLNLGPRAHTHHCSYFRDADVLRFLDKRLS